MLLVLAATGCVRRRLTVRTNPPGAMVYVDREPIGASPASVPFTYYGTRQIVAVGDGYRTETVLRTFYPPWYQIPPLDFVAESLWPWKIRDQRVVDLTMVAEPTVSTEELVGRAEDLRTQAAAGIAVPLKRTQGPADVPARAPVTSPPYEAPVSISPGLNPPSVLPPTAPPQPWRPGQLLRSFIQPGAQPVERIPEIGALQGGGYRPAMP